MTTGLPPCVSSPARWVALLHAVNLGRRRTVPMSDLRALCADLGFRDVETYIASGNVLLTDPDVRAEAAVQAHLEAALEARYGFPVPVTLRAPPEWATTLAACPPELHAEPVSVAFLGRVPDAQAVAALGARDVTPERWAVRGRALYQTVPAGTRSLKVSQVLLSRVLDVPVTVRNWRTVQAIAERLGGPLHGELHA